MKPRFKTEVVEGENSSFVGLFNDKIGLRCYAGGSASGVDLMEIFITVGGDEDDRYTPVKVGQVALLLSGAVKWYPSNWVQTLLDTAFPIDKEAKA